jgi:hypothetical protein
MKLTISKGYQPNGLSVIRFSAIPTKKTKLIVLRSGKVVKALEAK